MELQESLISENGKCWIQKIEKYSKLIWALAYFICLCYPYNATLIDSAKYYSLLILYFPLGFIFYFTLLSIKAFSIHKNFKMGIFCFLIALPFLLFLITFWGLIFDNAKASFIDKLGLLLPFCFIAYDLVWLKFFSRKKKCFGYLISNIVFAFFLFLISAPIAELFSFNGLEHEQNRGLISAVIFLTANVFFVDFLGLESKDA